ncbi:MAG: ATP-binding protein [Pseudomonadota bacterium]|nr:ATP-binding protein [Pseudomonadota bacterium]
MKNDSVDQLVLMAQMMAEHDDPRLYGKFNSHRPIIFIVLAGLLVAVISLFSAFQWESHVTDSLTDTSERTYETEIQRNLTKMIQSASAVAGFVEGSDYVTQQEFVQFSNRLFHSDEVIDMLALLNYREQQRMFPGNQAVLEEIQQYLRDRFKGYPPGQRESGEFRVLNTTASELPRLLFLLAPEFPTEDRNLLVVAEMPVKKLLTHIDRQSIVSLQVSDNIGNQSNLTLMSAPDTGDVNTQTLEIANLSISLRYLSDTPTLQSAGYLKWILVVSTLIFTASLVAQYIYTRRSIRQLANLAVHRANDLTAINSELTDEILSRIEFQAELMEKNQEIHQMNEKLEEAQNQLIQQEKLASLGQLAAGVAHEINNPVGYINSNLSMLNKYADRAMKLIAYLVEQIQHTQNPDLIDAMEQGKTQQKYNTVERNMLEVIKESQEGLTRVKQIVQDLKDFSRIDEAEWQWADLHEGIDSTLNIAWNEIKYNATVVKEYGEIPDVECVPSQINQVIMNLLVNSAHAMKSSGTITIRTACQDDNVRIEVEDDGCGIPPEIMGRIFDPFFTTKEVGKGTGLGLSLSYGIIKKHNGELLVESTPGVGTCFTIILPINHSQPDHQAA